MAEHVQAQCTDPDCGGMCHACTLDICTVCGGCEGSLTTECCGQQMSYELLQQVYDEGVDYIDGRWVKLTCSEGHVLSAYEGSWCNACWREMSEAQREQIRCDNADKPMTSVVRTKIPSPL